MGEIWFVCHVQGSESTLIFSAQSGSHVHRFFCDVCILPTLFILFTRTRDSSQFTSSQTCFPVVHRFLSWGSSENHQELLYVLSYLQIVSCNFTALSLSYRRLVRARPWNSSFMWQAVYCWKKKVKNDYCFSKWPPVTFENISYLTIGIIKCRVVFIIIFCGK